MRAPSRRAQHAVVRAAVLERRQVPGVEEAHATREHVALERVLVQQVPERKLLECPLLPVRLPQFSGASAAFRLVLFPVTFFENATVTYHSLAVCCRFHPRCP